MLRDSARLRERSRRDRCVGERNAGETRRRGRAQKGYFVDMSVSNVRKAHVAFLFI